MMSYKFELNKQESQPVLCIRTRTAVEKLPQVIGKAYGEIMQYMAELGVQPADVPYTAYYNLEMQDLDVEIGFPSKNSLPSKGEIKSGEIPQGKYVSCMYKGAYSQMEQPYNEMFKWIEENCYEQKGVYYEFYYNSPNEVPESELLTKIVMALK